MLSERKRIKLHSIFGELIGVANDLNPSRYGCVVIIVDADSGDIMYVDAIGKLIQGSSAYTKYLYHASEKANRLFEHLSDGHITSAESADMETNFPGAVLCGKRIISASGQDMWLDEAISSNGGSEIGWLKQETLEKLIKHPNNRHKELKETLLNS